MVQINRLHMHGLPDRTAFSVECGHRVQNFKRRALTRFALIEIVQSAFFHGRQRIFINGHAAEPEIRHALFFIPRIHFNRQILQAFRISLPDCLFLLPMFFKIRELPPDDTGNNIAHAVVVADLLMLIPSGGLAGLRRPFADHFRIFF